MQMVTKKTPLKIKTKMSVNKWHYNSLKAYFFCVKDYHNPVNLK